MNKLEYLEKSKNEIITIDSLNKKNDCFIRYLFSDEGNENIVLDFINGVMIDSNFQTFNNVVILNPFNLTKYLDGKESIVDVKCITEDNQTVIIEIQLQGNQYFIRRSLYYWANSYSSLLNKSENYTKLSPVISNNVLDFTLFNDIDDFHSCYLLKEKNSNQILTDHIQLHYVEIPKFDKNADMAESPPVAKKELKNWILFLKSNKEEDMSQLLKEDTIFEKAINKYNYFTDNENLLNEYDKREAYLVYQHSLMRDFKEEGREEEKYSIAKTLKQMNMDDASISKATGLTIEEIQNISAHGKKLNC